MLFPVDDSHGGYVFYPLASPLGGYVFHPVGPIVEVSLFSFVSPIMDISRCCFYDSYYGFVPFPFSQGCVLYPSERQFSCPFGWYLLFFLDNEPEAAKPHAHPTAEKGGGWDSRNGAAQSDKGSMHCSPLIFAWPLCFFSAIFGRSSGSPK